MAKYLEKFKGMLVPEGLKLDGESTKSSYKQEQDAELISKNQRIF